MPPSSGAFPTVVSHRVPGRQQHIVPRHLALPAGRTDAPPLAPGPAAARLIAEESPAAGRQIQRGSFLSAGPKLPEKRSSCSAHLPTWLLPPQVTARSRQVHFRNGREKARARSAPLGLTNRLFSSLSGRVLLRVRLRTEKRVAFRVTCCFLRASSSPLRANGSGSPPEDPVTCRGSSHQV